MIALLLALAGGVGAGLRFVVDTGVRRRVSSPLPIGTMAINITGSMLLGLLSGAVVYHGVSSDLTTVAGSGLCGGYTTFSAASVETLRLVERGDNRLAALVAAASLVLSIAAAAVGMAIASAA